MSLSINTNQSAMTALENLNATNVELSKTQNAVSTGKKVATSADNPAAFGISSQIGGDIQGQSAVNDGLGFAGQVVSATNSSANNIISVLQNVQNAVTSISNHQGDNASLSSINEELTGYMKQIDNIARNSTIKGINLLSGGVKDGNNISSNSFSFLTSLNGDTTTIGGYASSVSKATGAQSSATLTDALGLTSGGTAGADPTSNIFLTAGKDSAGNASFTTSGDAKTMISTVQKAIEAMTSVTSDLGSNSKMIETATSNGQNTSDSLTAASGSLTDADMSAESAKLTALQTKQQLGIKSLSISNSQSQNVLSLFQ